MLHAELQGKRATHSITLVTVRLACIQCIVVHRQGIRRLLKHTIKWDFCILLSEQASGVEKLAHEITCSILPTELSTALLGTGGLSFARKRGLSGIPVDTPRHELCICG